MPERLPSRVLQALAIMMATAVSAEPTPYPVPESAKEAVEMFDTLTRNICKIGSHIYSEALRDRINQVGLLEALTAAEQEEGIAALAENELVKPDFVENMVMMAYDPERSISSFRNLEEPELESALFEEQNKILFQCIADDPFSEIKDRMPELFE